MFATNAYAKRLAIRLAVAQFVFASAACGALFAVGARGAPVGWALRFGAASAVLCAVGAALEAWTRHIERSHRVYELLTAGIGAVTFSGVTELVCYKNFSEEYSGLWDLATCTLILALGAHTARLGAAAIEHSADEPVDRNHELTPHNPWLDNVSLIGHAS